MVVLVLASHIFPSKNNFIKALLKKHPEITTIVMNVNNKKTSMVLGEREQVLYGRGFIEDTLCGKVFRISPKSFYQINPVQTEILYGKAIELAELKGSETVIEAYCGIGTIGIIAGDHVKKALGVELNRDAFKEAITNAKRNKSKNIFFYNCDAGEFMNQMASEKQGEKAFARKLESNENIIMFTKLKKGGFVIDTPYGHYSPDWAVVCRKDGLETGTVGIYFIVETKAGKQERDLTDVERNKIKCGELHFKAVSDLVKFDWVNSYEDFKKKFGVKDSF